MVSTKSLRFAVVGTLLINSLAGVTSLAQDTSGNSPGQVLANDVDYRALVSQSDLVYQSPAARSCEGQPIGNGRMGTLVWTTPNAIRFQRVPICYYR
jgi:hypothetical protein